MKTNCDLVMDTKTHVASGLQIMPRDYPNVPITTRHTVLFPVACCPRSQNPFEGSVLTLRYAARDFTLEVYSLESLLQEFVGGFPVSKCGTYLAERNMEGMCQLIAQMAADALDVPVRFRASLVLDVGPMTITGVAKPKVGV